MLQGCTFETERLFVKDWRSVAPTEWQERDLAAVVAALLTEPVTRALPQPWHGSYSLERAGRWIEERDRDGVTLLIIERATQESIGLVILGEVPPDRDSGGTDVRLGYLFAEDQWGKGFASELVSGFVRWCRGEDAIASITGGVARDNAASARVLTKNGFQLIHEADFAAEGDEDLYQLSLR